LKFPRSASEGDAEKRPISQRDRQSISSCSTCSELTVRRAPRCRRRPADPVAIGEAPRPLPGGRRAHTEDRGTVDRTVSAHQPRRPSRRLAERVQAAVLEVANPLSETESQELAQPEEMVGGAGAYRRIAVYWRRRQRGSALKAASSCLLRTPTANRGSLPGGEAMEGKQKLQDPEGMPLVLGRDGSGGRCGLKACRPRSRAISWWTARR
jgi:hypothetical protein